MKPGEQKILLQNQASHCIIYSTATVTVTHGSQMIFGKLVKHEVCDSNVIVEVCGGKKILVLIPELCVPKEGTAL